MVTYSRRWGKYRFCCILHSGGGEVFSLSLLQFTKLYLFLLFCYCVEKILAQCQMESVFKQNCTTSDSLWIAWLSALSCGVKIKLWQSSESLAELLNEFKIFLKCEEGRGENLIW